MRLFEWDPDKSRANITKHGVSFERASRIFEGPVLTWIDQVSDPAELREVSVGLDDAVAVLTVVHTDRDGMTRIISARQATRTERSLYEAAIR